MAAPFNRRRFAAAAATTIAARFLPGQTALASVAEMEQGRILRDAPVALASQPKTLRDFSITVANLTAAFLLTKDATYAGCAEQHLNTWLLTPETRLPTRPATSVVDLVPLAEVARSSSFLFNTLQPARLAAIQTWFAALLDWMTTARDPQMERDTKDHRASAWLLLASAIARALPAENVLDDCRHRFRKPTLRNQIAANGSFPQEVATANPYRNSLFNFDLLSGACQLLSSHFDDLWDYELPEGVGMHSVAAFLYPLIQNPSQWPWVADEEHFRQLPGRRPGLLFSGRAYNRPEYVQLWRSLPPTVPDDIAASFPIRQPLLWTTRAASEM